MSSPQEAADALAAVRSSQAQLLKVADCPPERHLIVGVLMAALVACSAAPIPLMIMIEALVLLGIAAVVRWDKRRTGVFVNGYRAGKTRWVVVPMLVIELALFGLADWAVLEHHLRWVPLVLAAPAFLVACGGSYLWSLVWKHELQGRA